MTTYTHTFATVNDPSIYIELPTVTIPAAVFTGAADAKVAPRAPVGTTLNVKNSVTSSAFANQATLANGFVNFTLTDPGSTLWILLSADGTTWVGPFPSKETQLLMNGAAAAAATAQAAALAAQATADQAKAAAGLTTPIVQNADGSWPARTTKTTDRTIQVVWQTLLGNTAFPAISSASTDAVTGVDRLNAVGG